MEVSLDHLGDGETVVGGVAQVLGHVALGIDDDGLPRGGVAHEVTRVREAVQVVLGEEKRHVTPRGCGNVGVRIPYGVCVDK